MGVAGSMTFGQFCPGVIIRVPLDSDLSQSLNYTMGVRLKVIL